MRLLMIVLSFFTFISSSFPIEYDIKKFTAFDLVKNSVALLESDGLQIYSATGKLIQNTEIDLVSPKSAVGSGRIVVYSNNSEKLIMFSRRKKLKEFTANGRVLYAVLSSNGKTAVIRTSNEYKSAVSVFDRSGKLKFDWECAEEYVTSISLSSNGKRIVIGAISTENGVEYSRILQFHIDSDVPDFDIKEDNSSVLSLSCAKGGKNIVIFDNKCFTLDEKGNIIYNEEMESNALHKVAGDNKGNLSVCYKELGGNSYRIITFSSFGNKKGDFSVDFVPACTAINGSKSYLVFENNVYKYSKKGNLIASIERNSKISEIEVYGNRILTNELGRIYESND